MRTVLSTLVGCAVILLAYVCVKSIMVPIAFEKEKAVRDAAVIERLIDVRKAQIEYKNIHKAHAGSFEDLAKFLNEEKLAFVLKEGVLTDEQLEKGMTEQEAVKKGIIRRDTVWALAKDTLFSPDYDADNMRYISVGDDKVELAMDTATLSSGSGYAIKVFECGVLYEDYLKGLDRQLTYNLIDKTLKQGRYQGLRVGSLEEINNNAGNWE